MKVLNGTKTSADVTEDNGEELYTLEDVYRMVNSLTSKYEVLKTEKEELEEKVNTNVISINNNKDDILDLKDTTSNMSMLKAYPIGSIYMSENNTNPEELFGGEWEEYGAGRTLVGVDTNQSEFASVGLTGGEKTHTLTIGEMPSHSHTSYIIFTGYSAWDVSSTNGGYIFNRNTTVIANTDNAPFTGNLATMPITSTSINGNSQPHNNLQPYITVYMWKRTA